MEKSVISPVTIKQVKGRWTATDAMGNTIKTDNDQPKRMSYEIRKKYLIDVHIEG